MNTQLIVPLVGLALLDSINPSTLLISALIATDTRQTGRSPWLRLGSYLAGVFTMMTTAGVVIMVVLRSLPHLGSRTDATFVAQAVIGAVLLVIGLLPDESRRNKGQRRYELARSPAAMFGLGLVVAVVEFAGAVPYLGALALMLSNGLSIMWWLPLLLLYNLAVLLPAVGLVALSRIGLLRDSVPLTSRLRSGVRPLALTLAFVVGLYLLADAAYYFNVFGLFDSAPPHPAAR